MTKIFSEEIPFLKGNLHTHTKNSDGRISVEDCIRLYKDNGYDFLALTDHRKMFQGYEDDEILVVPAAEFDRNYLDKGGPEYAYHITAVGMTDPIEQDNGVSPQWIVDQIKAQGAFCTLAHPIWSLMSFEQCMALQDYDAIEIYNGVSEVYSGRGYSDLYIDYLASRGIDKLITAVDDTHFYDRDQCRGYVMVQAKERTWPAIYEALMAGRFYASQGPEILSIEYDEEGVRVKTPGASIIRFMTNTLYDGNRTAYPEEEGGSLTEAYYPWGRADRFVRIEIENEKGRRAWSNILRRPVKCE